MAVFLSDIIRTEVPDEMLELMDNILDQLTPYFEAILNDIPDYLEEIINTLAAFEPAQSPREVARHLEAPQATIRNYLKQLKESGYVRIAFSKGKSNYYCLNEYLYRIWYQMRDSSHREETRWLMELLLMLYSPSYIIQEKNRIDTHADMEEITYYPYNKYILQAAEFISGNPEVCKVIEFSVDSMITDEKKSIKSQKEEELFKEREIRKIFIQSAPAFFVGIEGNGKTIMMNEAMLCATGYKLDEVVGQDYSHIPYAGQVDVAVKKACALRVRIPEWTQSGEVRCTVNGEARPLNWDGRYALIGEVREGDLVSVCFPIAERTAEVNIEKHCYTLILRGSEVVKIDPPGQFW